MKDLLDIMSEWIALPYHSFARVDSLEEAQRSQDDQLEWLVRQLRDQSVRQERLQLVLGVLLRYLVNEGVVVQSVLEKQILVAIEEAENIACQSCGTPIRRSAAIKTSNGVLCEGCAARL